MARAFRMLSRIEKSRNSLRPQTLVAATIYLACKELGLELPLWRIAYASGIEESTLRKALRTLGLKDSMPEAWACGDGPS